MEKFLPYSKAAAFRDTEMAKHLTRRHKAL